ncbi:TetR/AcrR family transcriptional regulator [Streptomyces sp. NPDC056528]|uniref:TetR/AcrR family transcriptional regulator n=1 Tax=unclassified Streptomyces TaxID=2593676 RepID=UPI0036886F59
MSDAAARSPRRADAQQNAETIVETAIVCLARDPAASMSEIAKRAGMGRVTLYGHFATRDDLVEAAVKRLIDRGDRVLEGLELSGSPQEALRALITSSWLMLAQYRAVLEAAQSALPAGRVQALHARPEQRVSELIERGRREGVFRTDLPTSWLTGVLHHVINGAAGDVGAGRLDEQDAPRFIAETFLGACARR